MSVEFYNENAHEFFGYTKDIDVSHIVNRFLVYLDDGAVILDAGCGAGRDSKCFLDAGYEVVAFDASKELAVLASDYTGLPVRICRFREFISEKQFDAIWACSSLLHVPAPELSDTLTHLAQYLEPSGVFYCSFKYGSGDREMGIRHFTDCNEQRLRQFLEPTPLTIEEMWQTSELRPGHVHEQWLNAILRYK